MSIKSHRAALVAAIGSRCPYCGQTMQIPDRPPSRDHIKRDRSGTASTATQDDRCQQTDDG
jgi:hypothetical protein